jgi:hypothetical protein
MSKKQTTKQTGGQSDSELAILSAIDRWKQTAASEIDNIGAWRDIEDKIYYIGWEKIPNGFFTDTACILSHIANRYPKLDPDPIQKVYAAVYRWYETRSAENIPPQIDLVLTGDLAVQVINVLEDSIIEPGRFNDNKTQAATGADARTPPSISENIFKKNGDFWLVRFNSMPEEPRMIKGSIGMGYIAKMLASDKPISAIELDRSVVDVALLNKSKNLLAHDSDDNFGVELTTETTQPLADREALQATRQRLNEIPAEIDKAKKIFDNAAVARLEEERDDIQVYLDQTLRPGSSTRKNFQTTAAKAVDRVRKAIDRAIESIPEKQNLDTLKIHLQAIKQNGIDFSYTPDRKMNWEL